MRRALSVAVVIAALVLGWLVTRDVEPSPLDTEATASRHHDASGATTSTHLSNDAPISTGDAAAVTPIAPERAVAETDWTIRILDVCDSPISGAELTVNALNNDVTGSFQSRSLTDALWLLPDRNDRILRERFESTSSSDGVAELPDAAPLDPSHGAQIWVTHTHFHPAQINLPPDAPFAELPPSVVLEDAAPAKATVTDLDSEGLSGATVFQLAALEPGDVPAWTDRALMSRRALLRTTTTDASGTALLHVVDGPRWTWAVTSEGHESQRVLTESHVDIELTIPANAHASGSIISTDGTPVGPWAMVSVESRHRSVGWRALNAVPVEESRFEGVSLPLTEENLEFRFRVIAGEVLSEWVVVDPPLPGASISVELPVSTGYTKWFYCHEQGDEEAAIEGARVRVSWLDSEQQTQSMKGVTPSTGYAKIEGLPIHLETRVEAESDFHAQTTWESIVYTPGEEPTVLSLELHRAPSVQGRVTLDGEAVKEFIVHLLPDWDRALSSKLGFTGREDGAFTLPGVAIGTYEIVVNSPAEMAQSQSVRIDQVEQGLTGLEIPLDRGLIGIGHAVDSATGESVEAQILALIPDGDGATFGTFPWVDSAPDGSFEVQGVSKAYPTVGVVAEGYQYNVADARDVSAGRADFGEIGLHPGRHVTLQLSDVSPGNSQHYGAHWSSATNALHAPFDGTGRLELPAVIGRRTVTLRRPTGVEERIQFDVKGSPPWEVAIDTREDSTLEIEFVDASGSPATGVTGVTLTWRDAFGSTRYRSEGLAADATSYTGAGVSPGFIYVCAFNDSDAYLDLTEVSGETSQHAQFIVGTPITVAVFVNPDGEILHPITAVSIVGEGESAMPLVSKSGPGGKMALNSSWLDEYGIGFDDYGERFGLPRLVATTEASEEGVTQIQIEAVASLDVAIASLGEPAPELTVQVLDPGGVFVFDIATTDETGRLHLTGIGEGTYLVRCSDRRFLPTERLVATDRGNTPMEVFPYTSANLRLMNSEAAPLQGFEIELRHVATGDSTADWITRGWVRDFTHKSDEQGVVRLPGVAAGSYQLSARRGGVTFQVELVLPINPVDPIDVVLAD